MLDKEKRIIVSLAGRPRDNPASKSKSWQDVVRGADSVITMQREEADIRPHRHRRGNFVALACGISYGGGQMVCHPSY